MPGFFREHFTDFSQSQEQIYTNNKQGRMKNQSKRLIKIYILPTLFAILDVQPREGEGQGPGRGKALCRWHEALFLSGNSSPWCFSCSFMRIARNGC